MSGNDIVRFRTIYTEIPFSIVLEYADAMVNTNKKPQGVGRENNGIYDMEQAEAYLKEMKRGATWLQK